MKSVNSIWMFLLLLLPLVARAAGDPVARFDAANKLYEEGRYAAAVTEYDGMIDSGHASAAVFFNRGNAFFKQGQLGRAIASYRLSEQLAPRDTDLRSNLQLARTRARGGVPFHTGLVQSWLGRLSLNEWTLLTGAAVWLLFLFLALAQWRPHLLLKLRKYITAAGAAGAVLGICLVIELNIGQLTRTAIVITGEAEVRNGPLEESPSLYKVRDGVELNILDRIGNWLQVMDPAQRVGWVQQDQVLVFDAHKIKS